MTPVLLALVLLAGQGRSDVGLAPASALAMGKWTTAVLSHAPGRRDASSGVVSALTFQQRTELHAGMSLFLAGLLGNRVSSKNDSEKHIVELARALKQHPGADAFLKRAAVLHGDVAIQNRMDGGAPVENLGSIPPDVPNTPPLLSRHRLFLDRDGEIHGESLADWNWPFARSLLDLISPKPADDPFVSTWYHATSAFMLKDGLYGEVVTHLERAAIVLPNDPLVLFDRASYQEIQGLPVSQVLLSDDDVQVLRAQRQGRRLPSVTAPQKSTHLGIPLPEVANEEAERLFRQTLRADPSLLEARVRLARLLGARKRYEEASAELSTVLESKPVGEVAYYAELFAGRTAQALGRLDEAVSHYAAAAALFPGAQSALLGESQAALLGADVPAALAPLDHLDRSSTARDPWWQYNLAAGRDADAILHDMWEKVAR